MDNYIRNREVALKNKVIAQTMREDFEEFWNASLVELRAVPLEVQREKIQTPFEKYFTTERVYFSTHDRTKICAYFTYPNDRKEKRPCVVRFHGGKLRKELQSDIPATGVCLLDIDVRGQGGESYDRAAYSCAYNNELMTQGLLDKKEFYMRNIYLDAVRAVDVAATLPEVDPTRIVTFGGSQGGALSIAASALSGKVKKCFTYVNSYACIHRRIDLGSGVFGGVRDFLRIYPHLTDAALETVSYFDINNLVSLLKVPTSVCLCLDDPVCLPEFVYSPYAHIPCEKELYMYPFWKHLLPVDHKLLVYGEFAAL